MVSDQNDRTGRTAYARIGRRADAVLGVTSDLMAIVSGILLVCVMLLTCFDIAQRKLHTSSVPGIIELNSLLIVAIVFLGIGYAQRTKRHISMTFALEKFPVSVARQIHLVGMLTVIAVVSWMAYATSLTAWQAFSTHQQSFGSVSMSVWPFKAAVPVGLVVFALELLSSLIHSWRGDLDGPAGTSNESFDAVQGDEA